MKENVTLYLTVVKVFGILRTFEADNCNIAKNIEAEIWEKLRNFQPVFSPYPKNIEAEKNLMFL